MVSVNDRKARAQVEMGTGLSDGNVLWAVVAAGWSARRGWPIISITLF